MITRDVARVSPLDNFKVTISQAAAWSLAHPQAYARLRLQARAEEVRSGEKVSPAWLASRLRYLQRGPIVCTSSAVDETRDLALGMAAMMRGENLLATHGAGKVIR